LATGDHSVTDSAPRRVLIVRVGAMGDVLHAMPAVAALRKAHPQWFIGWVVEPRWAPLLRSVSNGTFPKEKRAVMPLVNRVYLAATREWKEEPLSRSTMRDIASLRRELLGGRFDLCVDMQGSVRSAVIGRVAGARRLVGPAEPREAPAAWLYRERVTIGAAHVVEQGCELLGGAVGEQLPPARVELPLDEFAEETCAELLGRTLGAEERFVLIAPGAGWGAKQWPAERYGAVTAALGRRGYRVLINASLEEDSIAEAVKASSEGFAVVFPCDLPQLIALTRRASLVIAGDTGPLHLAAALERPVVALFGPTDPARNGPYGTQSRVLRHGPERRDHKRLAEPEAGLLEITADEVVAAALELLEEQGPGSLHGGA
jgi:heptosyltransferase I